MAKKTEGLRPRQVECLALAAEGMSSSQIGGALGLSPRTIDQHIEEAKGRLEVETRDQAIAKRVGPATVR